MLSPAKKSQRNLEIKIFKYRKRSKYLEANTNLTWTCQSSVIQIDTKQFDKNLLQTKNAEQYFTMLNLENRVAQMNLLEIETNQPLSFRNLYELNFEKHDLSHVEVSRYIKGECALLYDKVIYLANQTCGNDLKRLSRISPKFEPLFSTNHHWNSVKFGSGPRQLIYSDSTQIISIDSRVANLTNKTPTNMFSLPNKFLYETNEFIYRTQTCSNLHIICCSKSIAIVDERFPNRPLLTWKNPHQTPVVHLDVVDLFDEARAIISCDESEVYSHLFSLKHEVPISFNYPQMLSTSSKLKEPIDIYEESLVKQTTLLDEQNVNYSLINGAGFIGVFEVRLSI